MLWTIHFCGNINDRRFGDFFAFDKIAEKSDKYTEYIQILTDKCAYLFFSIQTGILLISTCIYHLLRKLKRNLESLHLMWNNFKRIWWTIHVNFKMKKKIFEKKNNVPFKILVYFSYYPHGNCFILIFQVNMTSTSVNTPTVRHVFCGILVAMDFPRVWTLGPGRRARRFFWSVGTVAYGIADSVQTRPPPIRCLTHIRTCV